MNVFRLFLWPKKMKSRSRLQHFVCDDGAKVSIFASDHAQWVERAQSGHINPATTATPVPPTAAPPCDRCTWFRYEPRSTSTRHNQLTFHFGRGVTTAARNYPLASVPWAEPPTLRNAASARSGAGCAFHPTCHTKGEWLRGNELGACRDIAAVVRHPSFCSFHSFHSSAVS